MIDLPHMFAYASILSLALIGLVLCGFALSRPKISEPARAWSRSPKLTLPTLQEREQAESAATVLYYKPKPARNRSELAQDDSEVIRVTPPAESRA